MAGDTAWRAWRLGALGAVTLILGTLFVWLSRGVNGLIVGCALSVVASVLFVGSVVINALRDR